MSIFRWHRRFMAIAALILTGITGCQDESSSVLEAISKAAPTREADVVDAAPSIPPPLIAATLAGDEATVRSLLTAGADPNRLHNTNTALTYAARDGFTPIARLLIAAGADVNWIDGEGVTPLILAAFKNHPELAALLLAHGADKTVRDQWGHTALDYALRRGTDDPIAQQLRITE